MKTCLFAFLLFAAPAFAQDDTANYCRYIREQAQAQADQLRTPSLVGGLSQPTAGTPVAGFSGFENSIANDRKASLTISLGRAQCEVYKSTQAAQTRIAYALPMLQKEALDNRLQLIRDAETDMDLLLQGQRKRVDVRNATLPALYALQSVRSRLESDRTATSATIAGISTHAGVADSTPIRDLIQSKLLAETQMEQTSNRQQATLNWDISLDVGVRHQFKSSSYDPYGEVIASYNLGARAANRHLRQSGLAYGEWKRSEQGDVVQNANDLKTRLQNLIATARSALAALQEQQQIIDESLNEVEGVDTSAAATFHGQLQADELLLRVEIGNETFSLSQLTAFLAENF